MVEGRVPLLARDGRVVGLARDIQLQLELADCGGRLAVSKVLSWPKRCKLAHAFLREYSYKRLKLAQLLGQLGVFLTSAASAARTIRRNPSTLGVDVEVIQTPLSIFCMKNH